MADVYSVSQVNGYIKNMFAQDFALRRISVRGEVSNCKYHTSGHIYFTLKDSGSAISAVMFSGKRKNLAFRLAEGQQVVVRGSVQVYEKAGSYQLYADEISPDGEGALFARFVKLRDELKEMGMFEAEYKKPIPKYALKVGVVTAQTGAAIRDIMNISARRNPYVQLILCPAYVQGEEAAPSIVRAIERLDEMNLDVLIVGRGGGSIEDLWAFNEEMVARAIFACRTPVISAVGHETDFTIADYVADLRAPTPSAAAELAVFDYRQFKSLLDASRDRLKKGALGSVTEYRNRLSGSKFKLERHRPDRELNAKRQFLAESWQRMQAALDAQIDGKRRGLERTEVRLHAGMSRKLLASRHRLELLAGRLDADSPLKRLSGGYAYVSGPDGKQVKEARGLLKGDRLGLYFADGRVSAEVVETARDKTEEGQFHGEGKG